MNEIFIVIELSGLQQFLIVDAPTANEMIKNCERSINSTIKAEFHIIGSFLIFSLQTELRNSSAVIEAAVNLLEIINSFSEEIHEFSMKLLYRKNTTIDKLVTELKQTYFSAAVDSSLLIENSIASAAGNPTSDKSLPGYQLIKIDECTDASANNDSLKQLVDQAEVDKLVKIIIPEIEKSRDSIIYSIRGESELILRLNLDKAVSTASGSNRSTAAVHVDFLENETDTVMPFFRSIDHQMLSIVDEQLSGVELKTWIAGRKKLENINSDYPEEYFFSVYCLYLKGIFNFFRQAMQPAVLIFTGIKKGSDTFIRYAERIFEYLDDECSPTIFFLDTCKDERRFDFQNNECFNDLQTVKFSGRISAPQAAGRLNYFNSKLFYAIDITEGLFERNVLDEFFKHLGFSQAEISHGINTLESEGCIINSRFIRIIRNQEVEKITARISEKDDFYRALAVFINKNIYSNLFTDFGLAARKFLSAAPDDSVDEAVFNCLTVMLDLGRTTFVLDYLAESTRLDKKLSDALELRCMLIDNNKESCINVLPALPERPESPIEMNEALLMLETARFFHAMSDYQRALDYIKKVLMFLQEGDYPRLEGIAFIELGFIMMCKGKLLESSEYLSLAAEKLFGSGDQFSLMKAFLFTAVQQYLWGSLDSSMDSTEKAAEIACARGFQEWHFYIDFFKCRLFFELGRYYDAEKLLAECLLETEIYRSEGRKKIFSAWTARACIYQGKIYRGINMLLSLDEDPEVLFFLAEAYYFNGNMERALESIEKAGGENAYFDLGFLSLEHIKWKNGFSSVEGRVLRSEKGTGVLLHNIRALHAFLLGMTGNRDYGTEILFSLTRDEKISENDPYNRLYYYFYCQLLESRQNTEMIDKLTLISKALKYIQQTGSRINTPAVRQQFMMKNYWNSRLVAEAQREKLI